MYKRIPTATRDTIDIRATEFIAYHVADIRPMSKLAVRYGNISSFQPRKWVS